ncbi:MAG TPA: glycosyltransferase [Candidatus Solibacter sp.]|jgi:glycosyltransferase involved in cell wall biosynthesis|nr:glycosyltransferase [Candidatus Solibacter sp.]
MFHPEFEATIIISTRNRARTLADTLHSLQTEGSRTPREVIVVNNGSTDSTDDVIRDASRSGQVSVRGLAHTAPGKSRALNAAISESDSPFLLFTDDDALVEAGWADALVAPFADDAVAVVGGRTVAAWPDTPPPPWLGPRVAEDLGLRDLGSEPRPLEPYDIIGVNMALRRSAVENLEGPFETSLGPRRGVKIDYEEFHLASILAAEAQLVYAPGALVHHRVDAARLDWKWMRKMYFQRGIGRARHWRMVGKPVPSVKGGAWLLARSYTHSWRLGLAHPRSGPRDATEALEEASSFILAGMHLESLFVKLPRLSERLSTILV